MNAGFSLKLSSLSRKNFVKIPKTVLNMKTSAATKESVRVRFAPSPTGSLHIGGARTALFNWLLAKKTNGKFIIRVEDTDEARSTKESEASILNDLKWMNMSWDEGPEVGGPYGPYRQSERKDIYKKFADQLIADGHAYPCFCSEEELDRKRIAAEEAGLDPKYDGTWRNADPNEVQKNLEMGIPYTVRFKVPPGKVVSIMDRVRGNVTWDADASLGDFIIMRSNGMPVYNYCVSVDDACMKITHVIRAEEHLTNTLRQMLILEALKYTPPTYAHCSLILGSDRSKLSKRHGATSVQQYSQQGFIPRAMMNYLANLGWNSGTNKEIFTPDELIEAFDLDRIVKTPAMFDMEKLRWVNAQHLRMLTLEEVQPLVLERLQNPNEPVIDSKDVQKNPNFNEFMIMASKIAQRDMEVLTDVNILIGYCLKYPIENSFHTDIHVEEVLNDTLFTVLNALIRDFEANAIPLGLEPNFNDLWKVYVKKLGAELGLKGKALFHPLRLALTGRMSGPDVGDQIKLLALATSGIISPSYPVVDFKQRIEYLKTFDLEAARNKINELKIRLQNKAKEALEAKESNLHKKP